MKAKISFIICNIFLTAALIGNAPVNTPTTNVPKLPITGVRFPITGPEFTVVHSLKIVSPNGDLIIIEDDSAWNVFPVDGTVLKWQITDSLKIEPNAAPKTKDDSYLFKITNTTRNESVLSNIKNPARQSNPFALAIRLIDRKESVIISQRLNPPYDRTYWQVADADKDKIRNWLINQYILIGNSIEPSAVFTFSQPKKLQDDTTYILINENINSYVNVKKLY